MPAQPTAMSPALVLKQMRELALGIRVDVAAANRAEDTVSGLSLLLLCLLPGHPVTSAWEGRV